MKATVVGLVTPHLLRVIDLAKDAEAGINVDWHVRDAVGRTLSELGQQYNARELLAAYVHGLETAAEEARMRVSYKRVLRAAVEQASPDLAKVS